MPNIHTKGSKYSPPLPLQGWEWLPFEDNSQELITVKRAILIINSRIKGSKPCEHAFKALPGGKPFSVIWNNLDIWISRDPDNSGNKYGVTLSRRHISVTEYALKMGHWTTAATIIHELAHVDGAGGHDTKAEDTLLKCMLKNQHNPNIIGRVIRAKLTNESIRYV